MTLRKETETRDLLLRTFVLRADTINEAERSVDAVLATEDPTIAFDMRCWEPVEEVLRMDGFEPVDQCVLLDSHPQARSYPIGSLTTEDVRGSIRNIHVSGDKLLGRNYFADDETSLRAWGKVRDKHVRDMSIGSVPLEQTEIAPGQTATVNGKQYTAGTRKLFVTTRWTIGEGSITPRGADKKAKIRQAMLPTAGTQERFSMNEMLRAYLESIGLPKDADEAAVTAFTGKLTAPQKAEAERLRAAQPGQIATATVEGGVQTTNRGALPQAAGSSIVPPGTGGDGASLSLDHVRAEAAAGERARIRRLSELAGEDVPQETLRQAVDGGWDEAQASVAFLSSLRGSRPNGAAAGPAIHIRGHEKDCTADALATGLMLRMGTRVVNPRASEAVQAEQARRAELGDRYSDMSLIDICREAVRLDGRSAPHNRSESIRTAVSGGSLVAIFTTNVNARFLPAFMESPDTTQGWVSEVDVADFKVNERFSLGKTAMPKRTPRGKTADHTTISDQVESYKIARYTNQFVVDEQDMIDDNFGAIQSMPVEMGNACGRLRPSMVYAIVLNNAALNADSIALFHTSHANIATGAGSALSVTSLKAGVIAISKQTQSGVTLNIAPRYLVVPQDLRFTAAELLKSAEVRDTTASTKYPTYNSLQDLTIELRVDNRLGVAGVTDPVTDTPVAGLATNWVLTGSAMDKTIEVGYLAGTGRRPQLRSFVLDRGQWGIGWDIKFDLGAKALAYQGLYYSAGA
jgi:hypothetical protein